MGTTHALFYLCDGNIHCSTSGFPVPLIPTVRTKTVTDKRLQLTHSRLLWVRNKPSFFEVIKIYKLLLGLSYLIFYQICFTLGPVFQLLISRFWYDTKNVRNFLSHNSIKRQKGKCFGNNMKAVFLPHGSWSPRKQCLRVTALSIVFSPATTLRRYLCIVQLFPRGCSTQIE